MPDAKETPRIKMRGRLGVREISIDGGPWLPIDGYIKADLHLFFSAEIHNVALYVHGPSADIRLTVLRTIAKEQQWEITGEFADSGSEPGPALEKFIEHTHTRQRDAFICWTYVPMLRPNFHGLPPGVHTGQQICNWNGGV
jgi:hypothetical protein